MIYMHVLIIFLKDRCSHSFLDRTKVLDQQEQMFFLEK